MSSVTRSHLVIGAAHWDIIARSAAPLSLGADVPGSVAIRPGGVAWNIAAGLAGAGISVSLCSVVGDDPEGERLLALGARQGIDISTVCRVPDARTDVYVALESPDTGLFGAVAQTALLEEHAARIGQRAISVSKAGGAGIVILDANIPEGTLLEIARHAQEAGTPVLANPVSTAKAPRLLGLFGQSPGPIIVANLAEARVLTKANLANSAEAAAALATMGAATGLVTDGPRPASLATRSEVFSLAPRPVAQASVTGAGDALIAGYLSALSRGYGPLDTLGAALDAAANHLETHSHHA